MLGIVRHGRAGPEGGRIMRITLPLMVLVGVGALGAGCPPNPTPTPGTDASAADVAPPTPTPGMDSAPPPVVDASPPPPSNVCAQACAAMVAAGCAQAADCANVLSLVAANRTNRNPKTGNALACADLTGVKSAADVQANGWACSVPAKH